MATLTTQNCNSSNIRYANPNTVYANSEVNALGARGNDVILYQFDISEIGKAIVSNANLKLRVISGSTGTMETGLFKLRRADWSYNEATWFIYKTGGYWAEAGALSTTSDILQIANLYIGPPNPSTALSVSITNIVQDAIDNNNGIVNLCIRQWGTLANYTKSIAGTTYGTTSYRPTLEIDYEPAGTSKFFQLF